MPGSMRLTRLRERGARIALLRADVTDERELGAALTALRTRFGPLNGVVHAAGAPSTGMLARRTRPDADAVLAAKTVGTLLLDRLCADDPLDFLLLCSSVSAVLGGPGQSDYGAANAFLDAFAQWRHRQGRPVTALGWGTWEGVGMAAGLTGRAAAAGPETGHPLLRPVRAEGTTVVHETVLSTADSWIVDDHRLMGHGLVPGTAYLELVRAALAGQAGDREIELHDVLFMTPVIVPDGQHRTVFTTIEERDGRPHFTVRSRPAPDAPWREHATGSASFHERGPDVVRDLAEVLERCEVTEVLETEEEIRRRLGVERFEEGGGPLRFWFGPRWQVLKTIRTGGRMNARHPPAGRGLPRRPGGLPAAPGPAGHGRRRLPAARRGPVLPAADLPQPADPAPADRHGGGRRGDQAPGRVDRGDPQLRPRTPGPGRPVAGPGDRLHGQADQ